MIPTDWTRYLGSLPKTGTTATSAALRELGFSGGGHSMLWRLDPHPMTWGTTLAPLDWYRRVYLHAIDVSNDGTSTLEGLRAYGGGSIAWVDVLHGMTHPWRVKTPEQAGIIFRAPTLATAALANGQEGLWSWAHRLFFGGACPSPAGPVALAVDALVDGAQLEAGVSEVMKRAITLPRRNERRGDLKAWLKGQPVPCSFESDQKMMDTLGYADVTGPREGGAVWRREG